MARIQIIDVNRYEYFRIVSTEPGSALERKGLSLQAVGLHTYLKTRGPHWTTSLDRLSSHFSNGRHSINSASKELQQAGYLFVAQFRDRVSKRFRQQLWVVTSTPKTQEEFRALAISRRRSQEELVSAPSNGRAQARERPGPESENRAAAKSQKKQRRTPETSFPQAADQTPYQLMKLPNDEERGATWRKEKRPETRGLSLRRPSKKSMATDRRMSPNANRQKTAYALAKAQGHRLDDWTGVLGDRADVIFSDLNLSGADLRRLVAEYGHEVTRESILDLHTKYLNDSHRCIPPAHSAFVDKFCREHIRRHGRPKPKEPKLEFRVVELD